MLPLRERVIDTDLSRSGGVCLAASQDIVGDKEPQYLLESDSCLSRGPLFNWVGLLYVILPRTLVIFSCVIVDRLGRQGKKI